MPPNIVRRNHGLNHSYKVDGQKCRGVTTIISGTMPKAGLINWASETTADYAIDNLAYLQTLTVSQARKELLKARFTERDKAANRGTQVHALAQDLVHGREVNVPELLIGHVDSYRRWLDAEDIEAIATELVVANRAVWYCGSVDLIAHYRGAVTLIDLTTARSGIFAEKALQITAYRWAEVFALATGDGAERPLSDLGIERTGALHIRADGTDFRYTDSGPEPWDYFRHLAWLHAHDEESGMWVSPPVDPIPIGSEPPERQDPAELLA